MSLESYGLNEIPPQEPRAAERLGTRVVLRRAVDVAGLAVAAAFIDGLNAVISTRALGAQSRGVYAIALTVGSVVAGLGCLGVPTVGRVQLARKSDLELHTYLAFVPVHSVVGGLAAVGLNQVLVVTVLDQGSWGLSAVVGATTGGSVASMFLFDALHGFGDHRRATASNVFGSVVALILVLLVARTTRDPIWYLLAFGTSQYIQAALAWHWVAPHGNGPVQYRWQAHRRVLRAGASALPYQASTFATFRVDRYLVGVISGVTAAGIYSVAATLSEVSRILPLAIGQVLVFGRSSGRVTRASERRARLLALAGTWAVLGGVMVAAPYLIHVLFGEEFQSAVGPLRLLLVAEGLLASWFIDNRLLIGSGRFGAASATACLAAAAVIAFDLALVPPFGLIGAAGASVLAYGAAAVVARHLLRRGGQDAP